MNAVKYMQTDANVCFDGDFAMIAQRFPISFPLATWYKNGFEKFKL